MRTQIMIIGIGLGVGLAACTDNPGGLSCTEMGCGGELTITLSTEDLVDAEYVLDMERDEDSESCSFAIPFEQSTASCTQGSGIALEDGQIRIDTFTGMGGNFQTLVVELSESDRVLLSSQIDVEWSEPFYPNGEKCDKDMGCYSGTVELILD